MTHTSLFSVPPCAGTSPPSDVEAVQHGLTSIIVTWTASSDATGYRIHYTSDSDSGSKEVGFSATSLTLSVLKNGETYSISIVATSQDLPTSYPITREVELCACVYMHVLCVCMIAHKLCITKPHCSEMIFITIVPAPDNPTIEMYTTRTTVSISFSWSLPAGSTGSQVSWRLTGRGRRAARQAEGGTSGPITGDSYTITDLSSGSSYDITLTIFHPAGNTSTTFTTSTDDG